jgi:predicted AlkP superfamily pyrophosphatase or phosphodiesterase
MRILTSSRITRLLRLFWLFSLIASFLLAADALAQDQAPLLLMISVEGMRPDYITEADVHGGKVPNLRRFLKEGTYAEGVVGVVPTVTYPSHTTPVKSFCPN